MSLYEDAVSAAVKLPLAQREQLAQAIGLKLAPRATLPMALSAPDLSKANPQAWKSAERGHAVLDTGSETTLTPGPDALRGMWAHLDLNDSFVDEAVNAETVSQLPRQTPVIVHTSVVLALALGLPSTKAFWENPPVEIRIATATYLKLLEMCADESERQRVKAFVEPFAVLSLGPMASTKSAQLMLEGGENGLTALDALIAATALAHEIPLVTRTPRSFGGIPNLIVATLP